MTYRIAPLIGKTISYHRLEHHDVEVWKDDNDDIDLDIFDERPDVYDVVLWKDYHECILVKPDTFNYLYVELNDELCALKEDCIEYVIYRYEKSSDEYPDWYLKALDDGTISNKCGFHIFNNGKKDVVMRQYSVILRNFKGQLMYMDKNAFREYYEII